MQTNQIHSIFLKCSSLVIDTRKIAKNSIFLAIKGERFDANTFAEEALNLGALYVIIDNATYFIDEKTNRHVKTVSKSVTNGSETEVETTFNDFKQNADGYWFPYTVTNAQGTVIFDKIETNVNLDSKIFSN